MAGRLEVTPLGGGIAAMIGGVDATRPLDGATRKALYDVYLKHGLILLRDQHLTPEQHIAFSSLFGALELHPIEQIRLPGHPEIIELTMRGRPRDTDSDDEIVGGIRWHSDLTYTQHPSRCGILYAHIVPEEGGHTGFIDTAAAYEALSASMKKRIEGLEVLHSFAEPRDAVKDKFQSPDTRAAARRTTLEDAHAQSSKLGIETPKFPEVIQPLVFTHPENGRKSLNVSPLFARFIVGVPEDEGRDLFRELIAHATAASRAHMHSWCVGDIFIWDNYRTMHMGAGWKAKYMRLMHRTTVKGRLETGRLAA